MPKKRQSPGQRCHAARAPHQGSHIAKHTTTRGHFSFFADSHLAPFAPSALREALPGLHYQAYSRGVAANSATGFGDPDRKRRTGAHHSIAGAFFVPAMPCYGGRAWETFGSAGFRFPRFANLRTAASPNRLATVRGSSINENGATPMTALNPSKVRVAAHRAMALAALRSNASLSVRLNRYNHHRAIQRTLEARLDACDWLESLEGDAWADACEEIAAALKAGEVRHG